MSSGRVLVVEDDRAIRHNLVTLLRLEGFTVLAAENGRDALAQLAKEPVDLILSDMMMPVMDGHALLAALRSDPAQQSTPFIFLTARGGRSDVRDGMDLGADDYITKPFQRDELLKSVRSRLQRAQAQQISLQRLEQEARRLLHFDELTNLPNRGWLADRLAAALEQSQRRHSGLAVLMVGLDGLGRINEAYGREAGDRLLRELANRLHTLVKGRAMPSAFDAVARGAGDEFVIVVEGFASAAELETYTQGLADALAAPVREGAKDLFVTACIGISVCPHGAEACPGDTMVQQAETALRQAKQQGAASRVVYSSEIRALLSRRLQLQNALHRAIELGQLSLHYQPQVDIGTEAVVGCEALMRWHHPELGQVSPAEFIPVAEESGLIVEMGSWALDTACRQARAWLDEGLPVRVAVNLSARQVHRGDLVEVVEQALDRVGLPPGLLELEITESLALQDVEQVIRTLSALKARGVKLAMDDFGTGYSSLAYLKRLPLDILKVDQSFVRNAISDPGDAAITRAVIAMAHAFGMSVIAEGVETAAHLTLLRELDCGVAQGYFFSRPLPPDEARAYFKQHGQA